MFEDDTSPYGVMDTAGNVEEWADYEWEKRNWKYYFNFCRKRNSTVLRGGAWGDYDPYYFRCSDRIRNNPDVRSYFVGFRVAIPAQS